MKEGIHANGQITASPFEGSMYRAALYGAGGHAKVVADIAQSLGYEICYVIDAQKGKKFLEYEAISEAEFLQQNGIKTILLGIGDNKARADIFMRLKENYAFPALVHKTAIVSPKVQIGEGSVVCPGVIINADACVGDGVILNSGCIVEHDNCIDSFVHISPNATLAGGVHVGKLSHIGAGSVIKECVHIESNVIIGAGSVVINNIAANKKVVGNPAKREL